MAGVSFYEALHDISYADGLRLINQWWLDGHHENRLRSNCALSTQSVKGLFS